MIWFPFAALMILAIIGAGADSTKTPQTKQQFPGDSTAAEVMSRRSGLKYIELVAGDGVAAEAGQTVTVHYSGYLTNGKKFDSSVDRNEPFVFQLGAGQVIKGWDEGVEGMKTGGKRKLIIPPQLGYCARGAGGVIPPNAELIFDVELLKAE
jgi:FKBP-type peptidyl-prolyl cis-trans isomerase